jgi:hypothetical protein
MKSTLALALIAFSISVPILNAENASNPLAKVKNTDLRWNHLDLTNNGSVNDIFIDGAFMATDKLKVKYELHYWETDATGISQNDWESFRLKGIYLGKDQKWGDIPIRPALGLEWILDLGDTAKGIGFGSDQISPFAGISMALPSKTSVIPLVQHFFSYNEPNVNTTAFRLIALQPLPSQFWLKLDAKAPIEWANDNAIPANAELQLGKHFSQHLSAYTDLFIGLGSDRAYDLGAGIGIRFKY